MKIKSIMFALFIVCGTSNLDAQAAVTTTPGSVMLDPSNWMTAIDTLYSSYDMVNNTITQIEQQYEQLQQAIEAAKSIRWEEVSWDGDFDIRNEIKDATSKVNRILDKTRKIRDTANAKRIIVGGVGYSLADLCGFNGSTHNFVAAIGDGMNYMTTSMRLAVSALEHQLTDKQKQAIYRKYGISPQNYLFVQQSSSYLKEKVFGIIQEADKDVQDLIYEQQVKETNAILNAAYSTIDRDGNMTEGASREALLLMSEQCARGLLDVKVAMDRAASLAAANFIHEEAKKEAEIRERAQQDKLQRFYEKSLPGNFVSN